jgi:hypothetical protein
MVIVSGTTCVKVGVTDTVIGVVGVTRGVAVTAALLGTVKVAVSVAIVRTSVIVTARTVTLMDTKIGVTRLLR